MLYEPNSGSSSSSSASGSAPVFSPAAQAFFEQEGGISVWGPASEEYLRWPRAKHSGDPIEDFPRGGGPGKLGDLLGKAKLLRFLSKLGMNINQYNYSKIDKPYYYKDSIWFEPYYRKGITFENGRPIDTIVLDTLYFKRIKRVKVPKN